jgi:DNA-binding PadR family transcriptional regulator
MTREALGDLEHLVLLALVRLGDESYGVPILDEITGRTGRAVSRASVYIALRRLQAKGLLTSRLGESTPERGGRAKRFFRITKAGLRQLQTSRASLVKMWHQIEQRIERGRP